MTRRTWLMLGAAVALGSAILYGVLKPSDEEAIRGTLVRLAKAIELRDANTNPLLRKARLDSEFKAIFDEDVRVHIDDLPHVPTGRAALAGYAAQGALALSSFSVDFDHVEVKLDDAKQSAMVNAVANVAATQHGAGGRRGERAVSFRFARLEGAWKITTATVWSTRDASPAP